MDVRTDVRADKWTNERRGRKGWEVERTDGRSDDGKTDDEQEEERTDGRMNRRMNQ